MKILKLTAENIKRLVAVEIAPTGELVMVTGANGQGKTSILDSIWWALAGATHIQSKPIRRGEKKAFVRLDLGELIVERQFTEERSTLTVTKANGDTPRGGPQAILDALLGELSFDPLAFARMKPKDQFDELRRISKLEVDVELLDGQNRTDYDKRTTVNRDAKALRAQAEAITVPDGLPDARIDETAILDRLTGAADRNAKIEQRKAKREQAAQDVTAEKGLADGARKAAAELRRQADDYDLSAKNHDEQAAALQAKLDAAEPLPEPLEVSTIRAELEAAKATNEAILAREKRAAVVGNAERLEAESKALTLQMEARVKAKTDAIADAKLPVPGLGFGEGVVTYNDEPFDQASDSEQIRVSVAIAMAANPKLRVIRIRNGSDLDSKSLAMIGEMAKAEDFQCWIEAVDESGKVGFVIEDGMVAHRPEAEQ